MPEPIGRGQRYMPGLDGLRAIAVIAVILFHVGFKDAPGGLLGVGIFFTLSGYLITDILLAARERTGIRLKKFWFARARRLLPALFLTLILVTVWVTLFGPSQPTSYRGAVGSAAFYFNNWWQIFHHVSYFEAVGSSSPLTHLWSLSIEEQFYIVWPFLLLTGIYLVKDSELTPWVRPRLAVATLGLAIASSVLMALLYDPHSNLNRVYYGTDTRALELLFGCALAMVWPSRRLRMDIRPQAARTIDILAGIGLIGIVVMVWRTDFFSPFLYRGGFVVLSIATVFVIAAVAHPACAMGRILGVLPLRWVGVRSYGIYLYHLPIIALTNPVSAHGAPNLLRNVAQIAATLVVAELSWRFMEEPIRHGALGRIVERIRRNGLQPQAIPREARLALSALTVLLFVALAGLAGVGSGLSAGSAATSGKSINETVTAADASPNRLPGQSSCTSVMYIGDSTSEGVNSPNYLPVPAQRISAQFVRVGVTKQIYAISGARAIIEHFEGQPSAFDVAQAEITDGYQGCWVLALGTNDGATSAISPSDATDRIERMMSVIPPDDPVLWINVKTLLPDSDPNHYGETNMQDWNNALLAACPAHPNMRVYDWASVVQDQWFIDDGIHFTTPGYAARARDIADGLANAFPGTGDPSSECLVQ
jgi:peptidoglycan/LPS O-acetylase OafA/YrhL/lysophospholipase L1-like esterase